MTRREHDALPPPRKRGLPRLRIITLRSRAGPTCAGGGLGRGVAFHPPRFVAYPPPCPSPTRGEGTDTSLCSIRVFTMIGKLKGLIDSYGEDFVILDVGGVGYQVHCSGRTLQALPSPGEAAVLSIETYVREDQIKLFGFRSDIEREWFRLLQTVQGVGAKVALAVLGTLPPTDLANAIALRDKAAGDAHARRRSESRRAHRHRIEGQGASLCQCRSGAGASLRRDRP